MICVNKTICCEKRRLFGGEKMKSVIRELYDKAYETGCAQQDPAFVQARQSVREALGMVRAAAQWEAQPQIDELEKRMQALLQAQAQVAFAEGFRLAAKMMAEVFCTRQEK